MHFHRLLFSTPPAKPCLKCAKKIHREGVRQTWIYSATTTFSIFTPGKLIGKLLPPAAAAAAAPSSCSRWCSQGRVDGAAAVKVLVIQGSICAGNLKDRSGVALLALAGSAACQNNHGKASERLRCASCSSTVSVNCCLCPPHRFPLKINFLPGVVCRVCWSARDKRFWKMNPWWCR